MPGLTAEESGQTGTGNSSLPQLAKVRAVKTAAPLEAVTRSRIPTDDGEQKSFSVDRYHFRKDGAGYECREVIGRGKDRKRPYLAYLSRTALDEMRAESTTAEELEAKIIKWAKVKKRQKRS